MNDHNQNVCNKIDSLKELVVFRLESQSEDINSLSKDVDKLKNWKNWLSGIIFVLSFISGYFINDYTKFRDSNLVSVRDIKDIKNDNDEYKTELTELSEKVETIQLDVTTVKGYFINETTK